MTPEQQSRIDKLKKATGIKCANCNTCHHLGSEGDGPEYGGSWAVCDYRQNFSYMKSFPFKKEMKCWEPNFWCSKFTDAIKTGSEEELNAACDAFCIAVSGAEGGQP